MQRTGVSNLERFVQDMALVSMANLSRMRDGETVPGEAPSRSPLTCHGTAKHNRLDFLVGHD
jgi:hypothetical protein